MSFATYAEYQDSHIAWLGELPRHWRIVQARRLFEQRRDRALSTDEQLSATQKYGVIPQRLFMEQEEQKVVLALSGLDNFKHLQPNDFVISLRSFQGGIERSRYAGCVSPAYTVLRPSLELYPQYCEYLLKCEPFIAALQTMTDGIRDGKNISYGQFGALSLPLAPFEEQTAIANFLNGETAKIDALIAEQEKLIALLAEKRQATISHAVTRGLNPDVPMKDSGVAWLGRVPAHWVVRPLKQLGRIGNGSTPNRDIAEYWADEGFPWLNSSVVNQEEVTEAQRFVTQRALKECHLPIVEPPAILVGITGQGKTRGMATRLAFTATVNQHLAYIRPDEDQLSEAYLLRIFEAAYSHLRTDSEGAGSTKGAITCEQLGRLRIPLPQLAEQLRITQLLDSEIAKLDALKTKSEHAITLLKERRSALITAAVTGQIDVRGVMKQQADTKEAAIA